MKGSRSKETRERCLERCPVNKRGTQFREVYGLERVKAGVQFKGVFCT